MIGDRSHDIVGAKHNGMDAIGVPTAMAALRN